MLQATKTVHSDTRPDVKSAFSDVDIDVVVYTSSVGLGHTFEVKGHF